MTTTTRKKSTGLYWILFLLSVAAFLAYMPLVEVTAQWFFRLWVTTLALALDLM